MKKQLLFMLFYQLLNSLTGLTRGRQTQIKVKQGVVKVEMSFNEALSEKGHTPPLLSSPPPCPSKSSRTKGKVSERDAPVLRKRQLTRSVTEPGHRD